MRGTFGTHTFKFGTETRTRPMDFGLSEGPVPQEVLG